MSSGSELVEARSAEGEDDTTDNQDGGMADRKTRVADPEWPVFTTLLLAGLGLATGSQVLIVGATLPLWYVFATMFATHPPTDLSVRREFVVTPDQSDRVYSGTPGETVTVRTVVENVGELVIVDARVADGCPETLELVEGSPRTCATLAPGETETIEYQLELERGEHAFDDVSIRTRDLTGTIETTLQESSDESRLIRCLPAVNDVPLGTSTNDYAGDVPTDEGGSGIEFYSVREYEPGDPIRSLDWRRYARVRELGTVEYRAERATRVVCVVDARESQYRAGPGTPVPAAVLSADAALETFRTLLGNGHQTGMIALTDGPERETTSGSERNEGDGAQKSVYTVSPGTTSETRYSAEELLGMVRRREPDETPLIRSRTGEHATELNCELPGETQVFLFTSLVDDHPLEIVRRLRYWGYVVHVFSPDVLGDGGTDAARIARIARENRLDEMRATGAHVVDWGLDESLELRLQRVISEVITR